MARTQLAALAAALAGRPDLWTTAVAQGRALVPPAWWRHWPPFPLPAEPYLQFRFLTMYGDAHAPLPAADLIGYLEWCRRMRGLAR